jgi:hypothetical protein
MGVLPAPNKVRTQDRAEGPGTRGGANEKGGHAGRPFVITNRSPDQAAASVSTSSSTTGPESRPFASTSRSTSSMIAIGALSP